MIDSYYLFKNIPSIDLHEMNRYEAVMKVEYFIKENKCKKRKKLVNALG